ncbi:crotonase/enoyl-CoA hydratase family protein [Amycolatopsis sp. GM8]|uniref:crotonase/enoyl-CoA hydratase family protein n=1 Tax=Amycolatopsis sp. GM8 TaxID=2896530 RepID=UPI001F1B625E|nr:crotonase/enoyl-CoA hydratase family protein [Amycolatopsis sp. GM8]
MTEPGVSTERVQGTILVIAIDRPSVRNAVDAATARQLAEAFDELDSDAGLRVGILTGRNGDFCTGMDLAAAARGERPIVPGRGFGGLTERPPRTPLIAAVEGYALAGGFEMVLACDLIVASRTAQFGLPEVRRGLIAGAGGLLRLPDRIPYHAAMRLALTGERMDAATAERYGLLAGLVDPGGAQAAAITLAERIADNAPLAVRNSKRIVAELGRPVAAELYARQEPLLREVYDSADAKEGVVAFTEKRPPQWQGR